MPRNRIDFTFNVYVYLARNVLNLHKRNHFRWRLTPVYMRCHAALRDAMNCMQIAEKLDIIEDSNY